VRCASRRAADAAGLVAALTGRPPWLVQPQLQGTVVSVAGVAVDGGLLAPFGSRYRRLWPPESGDGTFIEPFQVAPALRGGIEQLVRLLGWRGVFQVELLEVDDRLSVLDFNPRAYGSMGLAQGVRAHLAALWVAWCLEERLPPVALDLGARYRWMESELRHALWQLRQGRWRPAAAVARPHARTSHAFFRRDDPLPAVAQTLRLLRQAAARAGGDLPPTAAAEPALEPAQR
jgi:hypothetical protein